MLPENIYGKSYAAYLFLNDQDLFFWGEYKGVGAWKFAFNINDLKKLADM
jgi:hypothetical protein